MYIYYHGIIDHSGITFKVRRQKVEIWFQVFFFLFRDSGSSHGSLIASSMITTTSTSMSTSGSISSCGTRYMAPSGWKTGYTGRTSSGGRGRKSIMPQGGLRLFQERKGSSRYFSGKSWRLTLEKEKMRILLHMITTNINTCDFKKVTLFYKKKPYSNDFQSIYQILRYL